MMALGIVAFVIAFLVSIMLHEAGHFWTARKFGMKASRFFVGFGPTLWSFRRGETEYGVKAIPAGGFVKIEGMTPLDEVAPEDEPRAFYKAGGWKRFIVLAAGSSVHFIIGLVLLFVLFVAWPSQIKGPIHGEVAAVQACMDATGADNCADGQPAPAHGKLEKGDVVVAVDGTKVDDGSGQVVALTKAAGTNPVTYTVERDGVQRTVTMTPVVVDGKPRVGIGIGDVGGTAVRVGPLDAAGKTFDTFGQAVVGTFTALGKVPGQIGHVLSSSSGQERQLTDDGGQVTSVVGVARLTGEAFGTGSVSGGVATLVGVVASVNIFVGIFNMLPLLPLDGGHVAVVAYERARARWARRRRRPDPGPVDMTKLMPLTYAVLIVFVGVASVLLYADVANPIVNPFQ